MLNNRHQEFIKVETFKSKLNDKKLSKDITKGQKTFIDMQSLNKQGFTLLELVITSAIIAIVVLIAIPPFKQTLQSWEAKQTRINITQTLYLARAESFTRHQNVIVCAVNNGYTCNKNATQRLIAFIDNDGNNQYNAGINTLLADNPLNLDYASIHLRASAGRHYFKFFGDTGLPKGNYGHIKYCPTNKGSKNTYQISISQIGRANFKPNSFYPSDCP